MNNPKSKYISLVMATLLCVVVIACVNNEKSQGNDKAIHIEIPSTLSVMSGTTPHEMSGDISEQLRYIQGLPDSGWTKTQLPGDFFDNVTNKANSVTTFSALRIFRTEGTSNFNKINGIVGSLRADCVRPDKMHVSQSQWDAERQVFLLDEWIKIENNLFVNAGGLWRKVQDNDGIDEWSDVNNDLLPEKVLSRFLNLEIKYTGILDVEGTSYFFLQTVKREEQGMSLVEQIWVDEDSLLIRKHHIAVYENNNPATEVITTFIEHPRVLPLSEPEWLNVDATNALVNTSICVVEHWK